MVFPRVGKSLEDKVEDLLGKGWGYGGKYTTVKVIEQERWKHVGMGMRVGKDKLTTLAILLQSDLPTK